MGANYTYNQDSVKAQNQRGEVPQNNEETYTVPHKNNFQASQQNKPAIVSKEYISPLKLTKLHTEQLEKPAFVLPNRERHYQNNDWLTMIIFVSIAIFASIRYTYAKYIKQLFLSLFNYATSARMLNDKNYPVFHAAFRLEAIYYIVLPIFVYQCLSLFKWKNTTINPAYFGLIFGGVLLYFFGKKFIYLTLGMLFETQNETREYLFNYDNFNRSLSLFFLPLVISIQFAPLKTPVFIVIAGLVVLFILNLLLLKRGAIILLKKQFSLFYLFLYLCSLEILPLLLIYKVVV
ncbi:DUF4271 domain-containing protein [Draconibacterium halophilum]|uniref:DUF4271 domain-containing protein n=1 Tax=Draconibacterium halophilum TaxID=2706887 RepID=A0A6C0RI95_9BACT|nr:DUF4271 domain-containing protein [Draconibacterium halophilum]QIA09849.1 DUF4271 domain-containing protein [Draconibacterium halophilum]